MKLTLGRRTAGPALANRGRLGQTGVAGHRQLAPNQRAANTLPAASCVFRRAGADLIMMLAFNIAASRWYF
jgi:hypothetical protein